MQLIDLSGKWMAYIVVAWHYVHTDMYIRPEQIIFSEPQTGKYIHHSGGRKNSGLMRVRASAFRFGFSSDRTAA